MVSVASIFQDASTTTATHQKNLNSFVKISKADVITRDFLVCLFHYLQAKKDVGNADNVLQFLALLFTEISEQDIPLPSDFHEQLIDSLLMGLQASNKDVRLRSSQVLATYVNCIDEISPECLEKIRTVAMERVYDKNASVRKYSMICLCRLRVHLIYQDSGTDEENEAVRELLLDLLQHDPLPDIRKTIVENLEIDRDNYHVLLDRARDCDASVRVALYEHIHDYPEVWNLLDCDEFFEFIKNALNERDEKFVGRGLHSKSKEVFQVLFEEFLKRNKEFRISYNEISWLELTYMEGFVIQTYLEFKSKTGDDDAVDELIPSLSFWVGMISKYIGKAGSETTEEVEELELLLEQLLNATFSLDLSDENGRKKLHQLILLSVANKPLSDSNLRSCIKLLSKLSDSFGSLLMAIKKVFEQIEESISLSQESMVERVKMISQFKILEIICILFEYPEATCQHALMLSFIQEHVFPHLMSNFPAMKEKAYISLALLCINDLAFGQENFKLLINSRLENMAIQPSLLRICLKFLYDWITVHGLEPLREDDKNAALYALRFGLETEDEILLLSAEGVTKCLLYSRVDDESLLYPLIHLFFLPDTAGAPVRQCLGYFFQVYTRMNRENQRKIQGVFLNSMVHLEDVLKDDGALSYSKAIGLMLEWTDQRTLLKPLDYVDSGKSHVDLATEGLELVASESVLVRKTFCQLLPKLYIPYKNSKTIALKEMAEYLHAELQKTELIAARALEKFIASLDGLEPLANVENMTEDLSTMRIVEK